jgi:hypothetical protein
MSIYPTLVKGSTGAFTVEFFDEAGEVVVPNSVSWSLYQQKQIVNEREDVSVSPASSIEIVLSGNDLVGGVQYLVVEGTYDSSAGSDLPLRDWVAFNVKTISWLD